MVQAARISITGTQSMEDAEPQTLKLVTDGSYCYEPGFALLSYVESEMTGLEGVVTSFQIEDGRPSRCGAAERSTPKWSSTADRRMTLYTTSASAR